MFGIIASDRPGDSIVLSDSSRLRGEYGSPGTTGYLHPAEPAGLWTWTRGAQGPVATVPTLSRRGRSGQWALTPTTHSSFSVCCAIYLRDESRIPRQETRRWSGWWVRRAGLVSYGTDRLDRTGQDGRNRSVRRPCAGCRGSADFHRSQTPQRNNARRPLLTCTGTRNAPIRLCPETIPSGWHPRRGWLCTVRFRRRHLAGVAEARSCVWGLTHSSQHRNR